MKLVINGEEKSVAASDVAALIAELGMKGDRVAVELNREIVPRPSWAQAALHEELKGQHRGIVDAVREGRVDQVLGAPTASGIHPAGAGNGHGSGLDVEWTNADAAYTEGSVVMRFKVTQGGAGVAGAKLTSRLNVANDAPIYSQASTDNGGTAEMRVFVDEAALEDAAVLVQAKIGEQTASKKFLLKRP